jgi:hypothetical protein
VALATKGTREERAILVRDPNQMVAIAVLSSPKLTNAEFSYGICSGCLTEHFPEFTQS